MNYELPKITGYELKWQTMEVGTSQLAMKVLVSSAICGSQWHAWMITCYHISSHRCVTGPCPATAWGCN